MSLTCLVAAATTLRSSARHFRRRIRLALSRDAHYAEIERRRQDRGRENRRTVTGESLRISRRNNFRFQLSQSAPNCLNSLLGDSIFTGNPYYFSVTSPAYRKTLRTEHFVQLRVGVTLFARCVPTEITRQKRLRRGQTSSEGSQ